MAAPLITRTPIHDDDGSGTTGTILDNAWKQELYNQIDADVAAVVAGMPVVPPSNVIYKASGANLSTAYNTLFAVPMPALGVNDYLTIVFNLYQNAAVGGQLNLNSSGDVGIMRLDDIGGGSLGVNAMGNVIITLRCNTTNPTAVNCNATGGFNSAGTQTGLRATFAAFTKAAIWTTGGWQLSVEGTGQGAGGGQYWGVTIIRS
jgi:hypothetical protein